MTKIKIFKLIQQLNSLKKINISELKKLIKNRLKETADSYEPDFYFTFTVYKIDSCLKSSLKLLAITNNCVQCFAC